MRYQLRREDVILSFLTLLVVLGAVVFSSHGLADWRRFQRQIQAARSRVSEVEEQNRRLKADLSALEDDPKRASERELRESLGWVRPGELVYIEHSAKK